jgi:hypothetical protein
MHHRHGAAEVALGAGAAHFEGDGSELAEVDRTVVVMLMIPFAGPRQRGQTDSYRRDRAPQSHVSSVCARRYRRSGWRVRTQKERQVAESEWQRIRTSLE